MFELTPTESPVQTKGRNVFVYDAPPYLEIPGLGYWLNSPPTPPISASDFAKVLADMKAQHAAAEQMVWMTKKSDPDSWDVT